MKNIIIIAILKLSVLSAQFSYPAEDFLGGGIGYSPMYIKLKEIPGADALLMLVLTQRNSKILLLFMAAKALHT